MSEYMISIKIEKLEERGYLATSDSLQGVNRTGQDHCRNYGNCQGRCKQIN